MNSEKYIQEIEKLNMDYIELQSSTAYQIGSKILRLKKNGVSELFNSIQRHKQFKKIKQKFVKNNLNPVEEEKLAREGKKDNKVVIYTCVTGNYDIVKPPYIRPSNVDYYLFSDTITCNGWINKKISKDLISQYSPSMINRYIKFHPFELFENEYDYAIYIDGNILPISDLSVLCELVDQEYGIAFHHHCTRECIFEEGKACRVLKKGDNKKIEQQLVRYKKEGFPKNYGMIEGNLIVYKLNHKKSRIITNELWQELLRSESGRDQLAWPYVLWKNGVLINKCDSLGNNIYLNPKVRISKHII